MKSKLPFWALSDPCVDFQAAAGVFFFHEVTMNGNGKKPVTLREIVATYDYTDLAGRLLYQVCRMDPKAFIQRRSDGNGGFLYNLQGVHRTIFRLPAVLNAVQSWDNVYIVEGEKDCLSLEKCGLIGTTNSGGANGKWEKRFSEYLRGAHVVILSDNDPPGKKHALDVASSVYGIAESVKLVELPDLAEKGDVTDFFALGHTADELRAIVEHTPEWMPSAKAEAPILKPKILTSPSVESEFNLTDSGNAKRLVHLFGDQVRYNKTPFGQWFMWSGNRWQEDSTDKVYEFADRTVRNLYELAAATADSRKREEVGAWAKSSESAQRRKNMVFLAEKEQSIVIDAANLDSNPWLFNCLNTTLDLSSGDVVQVGHRQNDNITRLAPVIYDPAATCPRWNNFLWEIFAGNEEVQVFVRRAVGYSLTGDTSEQCLFFAFGTGKNGKSVFFETVKMLLGDYAGRAPSEMIMMQRENVIPSDVARLKGKRMVITSEIEENRRLAENRVKDLTGGDSIIARRMYGDWFEFTPTHKLWIYGNHKPVIRGEDTGIWRRMRLIPFTVCIPEESRVPMSVLLDTFRHELSGILNWALKGYLEYREKGLGDPAAIRDATQEYRGEMDIIGGFIEENCSTEEGDQEQSKKLYARYREWCIENSEKPLTSIKFINRLRDRGFTTKRGHSNNVFVNGLSLMVTL